MARGIISPSTSLTAQQQPDAPPSTAAQLVIKFADGKQHPKGQDQETFRQLLQEVFSSNSSRSSGPGDYEEDTKVNHKLVYVIMKAGLDILTTDDPFVKSRTLLLQATDSFRAIDCTIRRNPEVLFAGYANENDDPKAQGPLYLWLLPKVLALMLHATDESVVYGASRLLETVLVVEKQNGVSKSGTHPLSRYMQGCIRGRIIKSKQVVECS